MVKKDVKFIQNELGNIELLNLQNKELVGFIKHLELYIPNIASFNIVLNEEDLLKTKNLYVYIKHNETKENINLILKQIKNIFKQDFYYEESKTTEELIIIDLFLYE